MNTSIPNPTNFDETLRLLAHIPAPTGLENRIHTRLNSAAATQKGARILPWPVAASAVNWMRAAAAAVIVCVIGGGGWGILTHIEQSRPAAVIVAPPHANASGGFSNAGAMTTPKTAQPALALQPQQQATPQKPDRAVPGTPTKTDSAARFRLYKRARQSKLSEPMK